MDQLLRQADEVFRRRATPWALVGGWAIAIRTEPRFTRDIDVAVAVRDDDGAEEIVREFVGAGFKPEALVEQEAKKRLAAVRLVTAHEMGRCILDLMFASCGIEPEICQGAEHLEIVPGLIVPVARIEHLLAMKILARDDRLRPQDAADISALLRCMNKSQVALAREALQLITSRGYHRGRDLVSLLEKACSDYFQPCQNEHM